MPNHLLRRLRIPIPTRLRAIHESPHLLPLLLTQVHIPTRKILHKPMRFRRPRNSNHALGRDPRECDLAGRAAFLLR